MNVHVSRICRLEIYDTFQIFLAFYCASILYGDGQPRVYVQWAGNEPSTAYDTVVGQFGSNARSWVQTGSALSRYGLDQC